MRDLKSGEHFGELALINNEKRSLSVRVKSPECKLLKLHKDTFIRILGSIEENLMKDYGGEFDNKMEQVAFERRRLSQMFDQNTF